MDQATTKTTLELDADLLYLAKQTALNRKITFKELVTKSLRQELHLPVQPQKIPLIGGHHLGGITQSFSRTDIYADL